MEKNRDMMEAVDTLEDYMADHYESPTDWMPWVNYLLEGLDDKAADIRRQL